MIKRIELAVAVMATGLSLLLHFVRFQHAGGLWRDEAAAVQLANMPAWSELWHNFQFEAFPLLFPASIRLYSHVIGTTDLAFRFLGLLIGIVLLAVLWLNARWAGHKFPLISVCLLGFNPALIAIGDAIRGYGLGAVLMLLTSGLLLRAIHSPAPQRLLAFGIAALAGAHCLLYNSVLLFCIGLAAILVTMRRGHGRAALGFCAVLFAVAASQLPYLQPLGSGRDWNMLVRYPLSSLAIWTALLDTLAAPWRGMAWLWIGLFCPGLLVSFITVRSNLRGWPRAEQRSAADPIALAESRSSDLVLFCLCASILAIAGYYAFIKTLSYLPGPRNYFALLALLAILLDATLARFCISNAPRVLRAGLVAAVSLTMFWPALGKLSERQTNVDLVAGKLSSDVGTDDLIVVLPWFYGVSFNWYYRGFAGWTTVPAIADHRTHRYDLMKAKMTSSQPIADVLFKVEQTLQEGHRVWVVGKLDAPEPGQAPPVVQPAPNSQWGWSDAPYDASWALQLGAFLRSHATDAQAVPVTTRDRINQDENLSILLFQRWRYSNSTP